MERITVMKAVTYLVENIRAEIAMANGKQVGTVTEQDIIDTAWQWAYNDFGGNEGLIMIDENGEQV